MKVSLGLIFLLVFFQDFTYAQLLLPNQKTKEEVTKPKGPEITWNMLAKYDLKNKKAPAQLKNDLSKNVYILGLMIPLDFSNKNINEFLLVPYYPSCAHVPPPPENQIIRVLTQDKKGIKATYYPIKVHGKINIATTPKKHATETPDGTLQMAAIYEMTATKIEEIKE